MCFEEAGASHNCVLVLPEEDKRGIHLNAMCKTFKSAIQFSLKYKSITSK